MPSYHPEPENSVLTFAVRPATHPFSIYLGVMRRLRKAIRQKRPDLWANNLWILHHDNAPSHNAIVVREHLAKNETNTI